jgi:cytochrome P450
MVPENKLNRRAMASASTTEWPEHVPGGLVRRFDVINDPDVLADPWAAVDRMRDDTPVAWSPEPVGHWIVTGPDELREVLSEGETFSSYPGGFPPLTGFWPRKLNPLELDGDEHARYRRLLTPLFSPRAIRPLETAVRERATELITKLAAAERFEFVSALARPLPSSVFLSLFGAPVERAETFTQWASDLLHASDPVVARAAAENIVAFLTETIAERQREPRADMISAIAQTEFEGRQLTADELLDVSFTLFLGGLDTVTNQLGVMALHLATHPEQQEALRSDPALLDAALDELLRLNPIVQVPRTLTRDYVLNGIRLREGDTVLAVLPAAPRSPAEFTDPTEARFDRERNWTTGFGLGPHRCVGMHLARQELRVVLELMTTLAPPFRLAPGATWQWHTANVWGLDRLDLEFIRD